MPPAIRRSSTDFVGVPATGCQLTATATKYKDEVEIRNDCQRYYPGSPLGRFATHCRRYVCSRSKCRIGGQGTTEQLQLLSFLQQEAVLPLERYRECPVVHADISSIFRDRTTCLSGSRPVKRRWMPALSPGERTEGLRIRALILPI